MEIHIFILCYNEQVLLPHTIEHYKRYLPNCKITIYDNESTDDSVIIAKNLGCKVITFTSNNEQNEFTQINIKNNCWKYINSGWCIVIDMDEWLCITEEELKKEKEIGTTILKIVGINVIKESNNIELNDINLHSITKIINCNSESKKLCFLRPQIKEMNYGVGAHTSQPIGIIKYSLKSYFNKHMCYLGLEFLMNKMSNRYKRTHKMREVGMDTHYTDDIIKIKNEYNNLLNSCFYLNENISI
jgi:hypothetical protein